LTTEHNEKDFLKEHILEFPGYGNQGVVKFGFGAIHKLYEHLIEFRVSGKILIIIDPFLRTMDWFKQIINILEKDYEIEIYSEVAPEPDCKGIQALVNTIDLTQIDTIVGIGGGSVLDSAKFAAILGRSDNSIKELLNDSNKITSSLPLILVPTTSGTGSEISPYIVVSDNGKKYFISNRYIYANYALVDPELTMTMPSKITASTGLDALTHAVEGMIGTYNPYTRSLALEVVRLVFTYLPRAVNDGYDQEARYFLSFASVLGMLSYMQGGGLYAHSMSYILTSAKKLPHGIGCGLSLPYTLKLNEELILPILDDINDALSCDQKNESKTVPEKFLDLVKTVGVPTSLKEIGIEENDLPNIAKVLIDDYYRTKNPKELTYNIALTFVDAMYNNNLERIGGKE